MGEIGDHALVLGASMGGLLAARVLADAYRQVTIVERDLLPESGLDRTGSPRAGTPMACCRAARRSSASCSRGSSATWRRTVSRCCVLRGSSGSASAVT